MKTVLCVVITALLSGAIVFIFLKKQSSGTESKVGLMEFSIAEQAVKDRFNGIQTKLIDQLTAFSDAVGSDKNFSLKLLVENDRSSPDVVDIAGRYMKAMGFSVLKIVDSANTIVSSGHFPASVSLNIKDQVTKMSAKPMIIEEKVMGNQVLTLQSKKEFKIVDYTFYALGGFEIDEKFLSELSPWKNVRVLLKRGNEFKGMDGIHSISEIKDHKIIINDKEYFASMIAVSSANDSSGSTSLLVIVEK
jgi:hypothetical protein